MKTLKSFASFALLTVAISPCLAGEGVVGGIIRNPIAVQIPIANSREVVTIIGAYSRAEQQSDDKFEILQQTVLRNEASSPVGMKIKLGVPDPTLVALEKSSDMRSWIPAGRPRYAPAGESLFSLPIAGSTVFYRAVESPMPITPVLTRNGYKFKITAPVTGDLLAEYLSAEWGASPPPLTREQAIKILLPPRGGDFYTLSQLSTLTGINFTPALSGNLTLGGAALTFTGVIPRATGTPELHIIQNQGFSVVKAVEKDITQNLKLTVQWTPGNKSARVCEWVLQRTPFQVNNPTAPPASKSIVGTVAIDSISNTQPAVWFDVNVAKQAIYGLEPPMTFYLRVTERDANGNTLGGPSNIVTIKLKPDPSVLPAGWLQMRLGRINCHDTTSGAGDDDPAWDILHVAFEPDKIRCKIVTTGTGGTLGDGESVDLKKSMVQFNGPAKMPGVLDHYFLYALEENDNSNPAAGPAFTDGGNRGESFEILANGLASVGKTRQHILNELRALMKKPIDDSEDDIIGLGWVRFSEEELADAFLDGRATRTINYSGDGSSYSTDFDLLWYPQ